MLGTERNIPRTTSTTEASAVELAVDKLKKAPLQMRSARWFKVDKAGATAHTVAWELDNPALAEHWKAIRPYLPRRNGRFRHRQG